MIEERNDAPKPAVTVGVPCWGHGHCLWLPLEGLLSQRNAPPFEVLICQEAHDPTRHRAMEAIHVAEAAGLAIRQIVLEERIPLFEKWRLMAQHARAPRFVLQNADDYSGPDRIRLSAESAHTWVESPIAYFYSPRLDRWMALENHTHPATVFMAVDTGAILDLPPGVFHPVEESTIYRHIMAKPRSTQAFNVELARGGFYTHGFANICTRSFDAPPAPYRKMRPDEVPPDVPADVLDRLRGQAGECTK